RPAGRLSVRDRCGSRAARVAWAAASALPGRPAWVSLGACGAWAAVALALLAAAGTGAGTSSAAGASGSGTICTASVASSGAAGRTVQSRRRNRDALRLRAAVAAGRRWALASIVTRRSHLKTGPGDDADFTPP